MAQAAGVIPSQEDLLAELQALKLAHPEMGAKTLHATVKEKNPTWLVSLPRVKKVAVEAGLLSPAPEKPTPEFVPGGPSSDAPAPAPVNPFLKVAADEFVPSAPAFVPSSGFGSTFPWYSPDKPAKGDQASQQPKRAPPVLSFADRLKAKAAPAAVLFISGATGIHAAAIKGVYERTSETSGGYALYRKRGDGSVLLEHFGGKWGVKPVSNKGENNCYAYVAGGCAAEACTSRPWRVADGKGGWIEPPPPVKMVAGAEAERQVGCCRLHAPPHPPMRCFL